MYDIQWTTINDIKNNGVHIKEFLCKTETAEGNVLKKKRLMIAALEKLNEAKYVQMCIRDRCDVGFPLPCNDYCGQY